MKRSGFRHYKTMLELKIAELADASSKLADIAVQKTPDLLEEVQLAAERELALRDLSWESRLAREIKTALARIDEGSYGICRNCQEEIKPARLAAVPWAAYCVRCQAAAERNELELIESLAEERVAALPPYAKAA